MNRITFFILNFPPFVRSLHKYNRLPRDVFHRLFYDPVLFTGNDVVTRYGTTIRHMWHHINSRKQIVWMSY